MAAGTSVFEYEALEYDKRRPELDPRAVAAILAFAPRTETLDVLDVGAGTGKATMAFLERGHRVVALEPGTNMRAVLRSKCPDASVAALKFEAFTRPDNFDILIAAQSWHWLDETERLSRSHALLRNRGVLALYWYCPQWNDESPIKRALDEVYSNYPSFRSPGWIAPIEQIDAAVNQLLADHRFTDVQELHFTWSKMYTTDEYIALVATQSDHRDASRGLLEDIRAAVVDVCGGQLNVDYVNRLILARASQPAD
jgi:trans-aconitate methyltransferase